MGEYETFERECAAERAEARSEALEDQANSDRMALWATPVKCLVNGHRYSFFGYCIYCGTGKN